MLFSAFTEVWPQIKFSSIYENSTILFSGNALIKIISLQSQIISSFPAE